MWAAVGLGCATRTQAEGKAMTEQVTLAGNGPAVSVGEADIRAMSMALRAALTDPELMARSGAPAPVLDRVRREYRSEPLFISDVALAGDWLLISEPEGPRWDLRVATPEGERMGMILRVPLVRTREGAWQARTIEFVRVSPVPGR
jgi:hypothetical protein